MLLNGLLGFKHPQVSIFSGNKKLCGAMVVLMVRGRGTELYLDELGRTETLSVARLN